MTTSNEELLARAKRLRHELGDSNSRLDRQCVTAMYEMEQALQVQAERIATLEDDVESLQKNIDTTCSSAAELIAKCFAERDTLHAEIAATAATEPVARAMSDKTNTGYVYVKVLADNLQFGTNLYTRPMPTQGVEASMIKLLDENFALRAELADMAVNTATYEHLVGLANDTATRLLKERDTLRAEIAAIAATEPDSYRLYDDATGVSIFYPRVRLPKSIDESWEIRPLFTRPMPAQDVTELVEVLEALIESTTGVDQVSVVNDARTALSKYKGAK